MKRKELFKLNAVRWVAGIIAFAAVIVFSVAGCATTGGTGSGTTSSTPITVTVTGDFSDYAGRKAWMAVGDDSYAMPLNVSASTTSLPFTLLRYDNDRSFTKPGNYMVTLWFRKDDDKSTDVDFVIMSRQINEGDNNIAFSAFSEL